MCDQNIQLLSNDLMNSCFSSDPAALAFWKLNFSGQISINWHSFLGKLFQAFGKTTVVHDEQQKLPGVPSDDQISKASEKGKREYARRGPSQYQKIVEMYADQKGFVTFLKEEDYYEVCLKILFTHNKEENVIQMDKFGDVIGWLGPFEPAMLDRFRALIQGEYFHGFLSKTEAEDRLRSRPKGTYLVRFSANNPKHFVISKKGKDDKLTNLLVQHKADGSFAFNNLIFKSFDELLSQSAKTFSLSKPCSNGLSIFKSIKLPPNPYLQI